MMMTIAMITIIAKTDPNIAPIGGPLVEVDDVGLPDAIFLKEIV